mmetsp:Transcript_49595/g.124704  ORF Transcript_49595/g.124704 Transcript_49595/m.124704 type:complete len:256 (+) Transcript_49595:2348-3115(+)
MQSAATEPKVMRPDTGTGWMKENDRLMIWVNASVSPVAELGSWHGGVHVPRLPGVNVAIVRYKDGCFSFTDRLRVAAEKTVKEHEFEVQLNVRVAAPNVSVRVTVAMVAVVVMTMVLIPAKLAVTDVTLLSNGTVHVAVPEQPPVQPVNWNAVAAWAASVRELPWAATRLVHAVVLSAQEYVPSVEVTLPVPTLDTLTVTSTADVTVTVDAFVMMNTHNAVADTQPPEMPCRMLFGFAGSAAHDTVTVDPATTSN